MLAAEPKDVAGLAERLAAELAGRRRSGLRFAIASSDERGHLTIQSLAAANVLRGYLAVATDRTPLADGPSAGQPCRRARGAGAGTAT